MSRFKCMVCRVPVPEESLYCDACVLGVCQGAVSLRVFPQLARIREPSALPTFNIITKENCSKI